MNRDGRQNADIVDLATRALRQTPAPPGPPAEVLATLNALDGRVSAGAQAPHALQIKTGRFPMRRVMSIAAAVLLFAGIGAVVYALLGSSKSVAFAEVRRQIEQLETMRWHTSMDLKLTVPGAPGHLEMDCYYKMPGLMRQEITIPGMPDKAINAVDFSTGKVLSLIPAEKQAVMIDLGQLPKAARDKQKDFVAEMKKMVQGDAIELGTKEINGRPAKGFRVTRNQQVMDIWVDPKTGAPLAMDMNIPGLGSMTMDGFVIGAELDESLFSQAIPEGYKLLNLQMPMGNLGEDDLIGGLRYLADLNDGKFPPALTPSGEIIQKLKGQEKAFEGLSDEEAAQKALKMVAPLVRMGQFVQTVKDFNYVGAGVAVGDAGRIICKYKVTESIGHGGKGPYRVVYGDLRIEDAPAPEQPPAETGE